MNSLPSPPPIIFKINNVKDIENTNNKTKIFKKITIAIFSKKIINSMKFKTDPITKLNKNHLCGIFLNLISL
jgi:hypothetical protein